MSKKVAGGVVAACSTVASTVVTMILPSLPLAVGVPILMVCALGIIGGGVVVALGRLPWQTKPPLGDSDHYVAEVLRRHAEGMRSFEDPITVSKTLGVEAHGTSTLNAIITRADGTVEDLGQLGSKENAND